MKRGFNLTLEYVVSTPGLYQGENFAEGVGFYVSHNGDVLIKSYSHNGDINPHIEHATLYKNLFTQKYREVFTRQELFNKDN